MNINNLFQMPVYKGSFLLGVIINLAIITTGIYLAVQISANILSITLILGLFFQLGGFAALMLRKTKLAMNIFTWECLIIASTLINTHNIKIPDNTFNTTDLTLISIVLVLVAYGLQLLQNKK